MKRYTLLFVALLIAGCASQSLAPKKDADPQLSQVLSENAKLQEQVRTLEKERDELKKGSLANVGEIRVGIDKAKEIAKTTAPYMEVKQSRRVEFALNNPGRWVAVWVLDLGNEERPYQGTIIVDAITGKVLNATNAPSGN
ncbi:MAG TPA: hypothetical protein VGK74_16765 [Symbiobacteriaceae bacterium]|jgi:hypothetical protein